MQTLVDDFLTVTEAAEQLKVAPSTIRRWIREGDLPAYRIGKRRVGVRREELTTLIQPADAGGNRQSQGRSPAPAGERKLTPEEVQRGLAALERVKELQKQILKRRGGELFPPSWVLINEARDERTRELNDRH